jgi:hypothetical protein
MSVTHVNFRRKKDISSFKEEAERMVEKFPDVDVATIVFKELLSLDESSAFLLTLLEWYRVDPVKSYLRSLSKGRKVKLEASKKTWVEFNPRDVEFCLQYSKYLSDREIGFVRGIFNYGRITIKQMEWLQRLIRKINQRRS